MEFLLYFLKSLDYMRFVKDSFEYIPQNFYEGSKEGILKGVYEQMEKAARICYRTENLIKEGSAERIINDVIIPRGHTSILEFGTIYLMRMCNTKDISPEELEWKEKYLNDRYSRVKCVINDSNLFIYVTTTFRTILQGDYKDPIESIKNNFDKSWKDDLTYICTPKKHHHKRYCYRFVMDRVGSQSVMRHRGRYGVSYAQESTRYCNFNLDKFDHNISYSIPSKFYDLIDNWSKCIDSLTKEPFDYIKDLSFEDQLLFLRCHDRGWVAYEDMLKHAENEYMYLVGTEEWKPEDARGVLPLDLKTEFLMAAYPEDWRMFLFRRCEGHAHPHIQSIAKELEKDFQKRVKE